MAASPEVLAAAFNATALITQIVIQNQAGEITEKQALEMLENAHKNVQMAFENFRNAGRGQDQA